MPFKFCLMLSVIAVLVMSVGCGPGGKKLHIVTGKIATADSGLTDIAGSSIEVVDTANDNNRGFGRIEQDGRFVIESLQSGELRKGLVEGDYKARIILNDEDSEARKKAATAIAKRYQSFDTSELKLSVPSSNEIVFEVTKN